MGRRFDSGHWLQNKLEYKYPMESLNNNKSFISGEQKIEEYMNRIQNGESKDSIFQDLPESFKSNIEKGLTKSIEEKTEQGLSEIPAQYKGLDAETLDFIWTIPEYVDPKKTKQEKERKERALIYLKEQEEKIQQKEERKTEDALRVKELETQLGIYNDTNKFENKNFSNLDVLSQDDFAEYLQVNLNNLIKERESLTKDGIHKSKVLLKNQLYDLLTIRPELRQQEIDRFVGKSRPETITEKEWMPYLGKIKKIKDQYNNSEYSGAWLQFNFGNTKNTEPDGMRRKGYITISSSAVEQYSENLENLVQDFNKALHENQYNGSFKISNNLKQLTNQFDSIVMHGASANEVEKAMQVLKDILSSKSIEVSGVQKGMDGSGLIDKDEKASHTQLLAEKIVLGLPIKNT